MKSGYLVAIFGGAVSGAEAAHQLTSRGVECVVFDQNILPFGKIEDGLPKWHSKLRDKEEARISEKLSHPLVHFVPGVKLGRDIHFEDVVKQWGFSAVLLAIGAWKDRPLPIEGIDAYVGKGLIYQNPFIHWFNHNHERSQAIDKIDTSDGAIVVGGGLASLDVLKVLMFETVRKALEKRGLHHSLFDLDKSISKVLQHHGLTLADLDVAGATLYYRRRIIDMPLSPTPISDRHPLEKIQSIRRKVLENYRSKYLFNVVEQHVPVDMIIEGGRLAGLIFRKTRIQDGRAVEIPGTDIEVRAPLVISSIGSIPETIPGIPMRGSVYDIIQEPCCRIAGCTNAFAIGNTVTGRGNIRESLKHGREVTLQLLDNYMADTENLSLEASFDTRRHEVKETIDGLFPSVTHITSETREQILKRVRVLQEAAGYDGNFTEWVEKHMPERLEDLLDEDRDGKKA